MIPITTRSSIRVNPQRLEVIADPSSRYGTSRRCHGGISCLLATGPLTRPTTLT